MVQSTGSPALTSRMIFRGRSSDLTNSSGVCVPTNFPEAFSFMKVLTRSGSSLLGGRL
jgi:hypothetical protein